MVKKVLRSAEKFSEPFPLLPLPLYPSPITAMAQVHPAAKGVRQKELGEKRDEISDRSIRKKWPKSDRKGPENEKAIKLLLPTSFCGTLTSSSLSNSFQKKSEPFAIGPVQFSWPRGVAENWFTKPGFWEHFVSFS